MSNLGLIAVAEAFRIKGNDGHFRTIPMLFSNTYKRDQKHLLISGSEYFLDELKRKEKLMQKKRSTPYEIKTILSGGVTYEQ